MYQQPYRPVAYPQPPARPPRRRRGAIIAACIALVAVAAIAATLVITLRPSAPPAAAAITEYQAPADGSGYDTAAWDQPIPLPVGANLCSWMPEMTEAFGRLGGGVVRTSDGSVEGGPGCSFRLADGNVIQVRNDGPFYAINQYTSVLEAATFAGLPGRMYSFVPADDPRGLCTAQLAGRSIAVPAVDAFARDNNGNQQAMCALARQGMELLARRYVPLAGGTPARDAIQDLPPGALDATSACDLAAAAVYHLNVPYREEARQRGSTALGTTCTVEGQANTATFLLTTGTPGLAGVPPVAGAKVTTSRFGTSYTLRLEQEPARCTASLEYTGGKVFQLTTGPDRRPGNSACQAARVALGYVVRQQLADSTFP
ncbi:hypothetical protein [Amycolatopsis sp. ATCC 39116]|uniref:hypothetical protein n=1 Tax=Amycolatopsis sp. (strain ATCC 39116 / 75iv2) TaxID=385957 RepID=UPI0002F2DE9C|nr:hypothetical protein [Amycolatopsis sp. ATCC 39116]